VERGQGGNQVSSTHSFTVELFAPTRDKTVNSSRLAQEISSPRSTLAWERTIGTLTASHAQVQMTTLLSTSYDAGASILAFPRGAWEREFSE